MRTFKSFYFCAILFSVAFAEARTLNRESILVSNQNKVMRPASQWLEQEASIAENLLFRNISPSGTSAGVVIASPQNQNPNYYRHWTRDAGLTMDVVFRLSVRSKDFKKKFLLDDLLRDYARFSRRNQLSAGLGEPIFEIDGTPFLGPWGRPQNDGPAIRAYVLTQWANTLLDQGETEFVRTELYSAKLPVNTVIKADLEYVSNHWNDPCFDLWEEVKAKHFYTKMVQRKALILGAQLARRMDDPYAADWYETQVWKLEASILEHLNQGTDGILASLNWTEGLNSKHSNLDVAVLLGVLHGHQGRFLSYSHPKVERTFNILESTFADLYPINKKFQQLPPAIGRYPEDIYAGTNFDGGNPWVLATLAAAEYGYKMANEIVNKNPRLAIQWMLRADQYVQRVQFHANPDGTLSEQIDRFNGYMSSAQNLTWNYAAVLTTFWARAEFQNKLNALTNEN